MNIKYVDLKKDFQANKKKILNIIDRTLSTGEWVGGREIDLFEKNIRSYKKTKYAVALNSGTDALTLSLHLLGVKKGDEVITTPNSFIASTAVITHLGAKPVFVDVLDDQNINPELIKKKITKKTKAILPIHLTGRMSNMIEIMKIANEHGLKVVEDAAQAIGSKLNNKHAGTYGDFGCFSAHPLKNLNALGDSGYLITSNKNYAERAKKLINHGMKKRGVVEEFGFVSRMDNLQAAILNFKLRGLDKVIKIRRSNADLYNKHLNHLVVEIPKNDSKYYDTFHTYVIKVDKRDKLKKFLENKGISTSIHYPTPIHLQPAAKKLGLKIGDFPNTELQSKRILTLPINQYLSKKQIIYISRMVNKFYE